MQLPAWSRHPALWTLGFLVWTAVLWVLSDGPIPAREGPELPHFDKVLHFGYFFGGGGLLAGAIFLTSGGSLPRTALVLVVTLVLAGVGAIDEWHQSWVPERSGNDPVDWLADVLGALAGALVFWRLHPMLGRGSSAAPGPEKSSSPDSP